jgi:hypothetical protein
VFAKGDVDVDGGVGHVRLIIRASRLGGNDARTKKIALLV